MKQTAKSEMSSLLQRKYLKSRFRKHFRSNKIRHFKKLKLERKS